LTWVLPGGIGLDGHDLRWVARTRGGELWMIVRVVCGGTVASVRG
jgi:hypothetical protein